MDKFIELLQAIVAECADSVKNTKEYNNCINSYLDRLEGIYQGYTLIVEPTQEIINTYNTYISAVEEIASNAGLDKILETY